MENKYEINCDYEVVLLLSDNSEMLIGGSEKTINKALKNTYEPNLAVKDLDIFFREQSLGTFALDLCSSFPENREDTGAGGQALRKPQRREHKQEPRCRNAEHS